MAWRLNAAPPVTTASASGLSKGAGGGGLDAARRREGEIVTDLSHSRHSPVTEGFYK